MIPKKIKKMIAWARRNKIDSFSKKVKGKSYNYYRNEYCDQNTEDLALYSKI